ncbi:MAG: hypothetical protein HKP58_06470 [Desulfatitalea sp.]|nr:hypothetical protein [Desulfatitalea sp.]NNK00041.1 hypothetical protein [Desulfatitalea sp.]
MTSKIGKRFLSCALGRRASWQRKRWKILRIQLFCPLLCVVMALFACTHPADGKTATGSKEPNNMFDTAAVDYPTRFANYQRNAHCPASPGSQVKCAWARKLSDDFDVHLNPTAVLVNGDYIGVQSSQHLLVYQSPGLFLFMAPLSENSAVIFGASAFSCFNTAQLLQYRDYAGNPLLKDVTVPGYEQWAVMLLFKPEEKQYLSVAQFTGGPMHREGPRPEKRYAVYRQPTQDFFPVWSHDQAGDITHALLNSDGQKLVLLHAAQNESGTGRVEVIKTNGGEVASTFDIDLAHVDSAALDAVGHLLIVGRGKKGQGDRSFIRAMDLTGKALWHHELQRPLGHQPPACNTDGRVFVLTENGVVCLKEGRRQWVYPGKTDRYAWVTTLNDNRLLLIHGGHLILIDENGEAAFKTRIGVQDEQFGAPAAVDRNGRIYIASSQKLYCFE